ncbi:O-methyltransferase [uncultured Fusobacterium sp.]|nr:O-methyltransferase [uncultured Fusobacterium sp.]
MLEELREANEYIISKIRENDELILEMEKYAEEHNVPIVTKEVAEYLKFIVRSNNIKNVLEVGTAIGYSGILMAKEIEKNNGKLYTIEIDEERYNLAQENFKKSGLKNIVSIKGDAVEEIKKIDENFDFVFIDASKGHYLEFFEDSYKLLNKNGIIFIDNIMFRGYLYKEYPKRFKTIVRRLNEFIEYLYSREGGEFVLLPFGDGIGLFCKQIPENTNEEK